MFNGAYSPIHHIARGDAMHASLGITQRDISKAGNRLRRIDSKVVLKDSAVTMRRVFAQAHVCCQVEFRVQFPKPLNSLNNRTLRIVCLGSDFILSSISKCVSIMCCEGLRSLSKLGDVGHGIEWR